MKSYTEHLTFNVPARMDFVNITDRVADCDYGPITLDTVSIAEFAPEPSALLLAACGVTAVAVRVVRGRARRRKSFLESCL
jgi:hypothetical protein